jgi:hypothetical protein
MADDLPAAHAAGVHRDDLVVEAGKATHWCTWRSSCVHHLEMSLFAPFRNVTVVGIRRRAARKRLRLAPVAAATFAKSGPSRPRSGTPSTAGIPDGARAPAASRRRRQRFEYFIHARARLGRIARNRSRSVSLFTLGMRNRAYIVKKADCTRHSCSLTSGCCS